ncbi:uncharacterized protein LOC111121586 isoform X2 [Crassostrea virginica]|uniref:Uncharacterized protein LOC111121586 isoform X2 n=1 Tax=Crassostrea virginica TaxID=6565 RepID=A0A8B8CVZ0_CRAVI|nr:uncharacterized protein LOC111121586 isoform X2 [Crassostrea virginica]
MRPAVYASVVRNRHKSRADRAHRMQTQGFSMRRLLAMVFVGALMLAPGLTLTVLGLDDTKDDNEKVAQAERILYKVLGPISCAVGGFILVAAIFYYCCYGLAEQSGRQRHTSSSKSNTSHHGLTAYSSVNSERAQENKDGSHDTSGKSRRHSSHSSLHRHHHHQQPPQQAEEKGAAIAQDKAQRLPDTVEINMGTAEEEASLSRWEQ